MKKVTPVNDDGIGFEEVNGLDPIDIVAPEHEHDDDHPSYDEPNVTTILKRATRRTLYDQLLIALSYCTYDNAKQEMRYLLESASCTITFSFDDVTMMMTLFVLFGNDIKLLCSPSKYDDEFYVASAVCLFTFIFELVAASWTKTQVQQWYPKPQWTGYLFSFFWWLDFIAILTMFADIPFIGRPLGIFGVSNSVAGGNTYAKAGRVVRLVRLVRLVKLYKVAAERRLHAKQDEELAELVRLGVLSYADVEKQRALYAQGKSRLGDQLSESTTRRVILMILVLMIVVPLLQYFPPNQGRDFAARMLQNFNTAPGLNDATQQAVLDTFLASMTDTYNDRYVDYLSVQPYAPLQPAMPYVNYVSNLKGLREESRDYATLAQTIDNTQYRTAVIYNLTSLVRETATFSIVLTIFVAIMMVGGALVFTSDAQRLVIAPIERMMNMVEAVAADPLATLHFEDDDTNEAGRYETRLLEKTIEKITGLLRVGFGEAGAGIISANLQAKGCGASINPLLPGVRVYAIFGFCDIHHFEDINQRLGNDVLKFVNCIAEIVHSSVHSWSGQCNKNLGNAFVIVWRIGDEEQLQNSQAAQRGGRQRAQTLNAESMHAIQANASALKIMSSATSSDMLGGGGESEARRKAVTVDLRRVPGVDILAEQALIGYCKIIAEINRNKYVLRYRNEPRLTDNGAHDFKVRMGFGLHAGWAIEGAVGSLQKVDATYLSPHVNMAARLETSSKQYGVPLLASQDFYDLMSNEGQSVMRRLDVVTVKGSEVPIGIYTYDALQDQVFKEDQKRSRTSQGTGMVVPGTVSAKQTGGRGSSAGAGASVKLLMAALTAPAAQAASVLGTPLMSGKGAGFDSPIPAPPLESPGDFGSASPQRRPSVTLLPGGGTEKPAVWLCPQDHPGDVFEQDYDMVTLRSHATDPEFLATFKEGIALYLSGDWTNARLLLEKADQQMAALAPALGGDGPSQTLLRYMGHQNFVPPSSWKGFRPLTSK